MPPDSGICVVVLWPELLGTYGDGGNVRVLEQRTRWRGIDCDVVRVAPGEPVPDCGDIYVLGGGEDAAQAAARNDAAATRALHTAAARSAVVFAVCAGFQLIGEWFIDGAGQRSAGFGLVDARTDRLRTRAVGEVAVEPTGLPGLPMLTGFENHGGRTTLGADARPLGRVISGVGNGVGVVEGVVAGPVIGTYLHGPVLARNAALADLLLGRVVGDLQPLDDSLVERLRHERLRGARSAAEAPLGWPRWRTGRRTSRFATHPGTPAAADCVQPDEVDRGQLHSERIVGEERVGTGSGLLLDMPRAGETLTPR